LAGARGDGDVEPVAVAADRLDRVGDAGHPGGVHAEVEDAVVAGRPLDRTAGGAVDAEPQRYPRLLDRAGGGADTVDDDGAAVADSLAGPQRRQYLDSFVEHPAAFAGVDDAAQRRVLPPQVAAEAQALNQPSPTQP